MEKIYNGRFCSGIGDEKFIELLDKSFCMLKNDHKLPVLPMLYNDVRNTLSEGFMWGDGFWIQNSYGFVANASPFLDKTWYEIMQNSMDLFWDRMGTGSRGGLEGADREYFLDVYKDRDPEWINARLKVYDLIAPDGCLGDAVLVGGLIYRQGDGNVEIHDWFYEATAAGVVMQGDMLLQNLDIERIKKYIPMMERSCNFIETARDDNGLFLVGPSSNLLAPSFGGSLNEDGTLGKAYLTGVTITYSAAIKLMIELYILLGAKEKEADYRQRLETNIKSLPLLLTEEGYFVKSLDKNGTRHGVYGADKHGYFEGVANIDALAFDVVDDETKMNIYNKIVSINEFRKFDFLPNNYPGLDDTDRHYFNQIEHCADFEKNYGHWVDGGCWPTVEGRAIIAYLKMGKYEDAYKSADRAMKWAEDFRLDEPFCQQGENTYNYWSDRKDLSPVSVMIDNFAIPAATLRGIFEYRFNHDSVSINPHFPKSNKQYIQHEPVLYGDKKLYISIVNGDKIIKVIINGQEINGDFSNGISLAYSALSEINNIEIYMEEKSIMNIASQSAMTVTEEEILLKLPDDLKEKFIELKTRAKSDEKVKEIVESIILCAKCRIDPSNSENYRPMTDEKKKDIIAIYDNTARNLLKGFEKYSYI